MTEEERQAFLMFAGTIHGQARQADQMIVGQSVNLKPISTDIQSTFAKVLNTAPERQQQYQQQYQQQAQAEYIPQPAQSGEVGLEQAMKELEELEGKNIVEFRESAPVVTAEVRPRPTLATAVSVDNEKELFSILTNINLNLARIANTLEKHDGTKRTKSTKSA